MATVVEAVATLNFLKASLYRPEFSNLFLTAGSAFFTGSHLDDASGTKLDVVVCALIGTYLLFEAMRGYVQGGIDLQKVSMATGFYNLAIGQGLHYFYKTYGKGRRK